MASTPVSTWLKLLISLSPTFHRRMLWSYPGNKEFHHFSMPPSSADSKTPWTNSQQVLQQKTELRTELPPLTGGKQRCYDIKVALTDRVWGIGYNDVEGILVLLHEFKAISNMEGELGTEKPFGHPWEELLRYVNDILHSRQHRHWDEQASLKRSIRNSNQYSSLESLYNPWQCCCSHLIYLTKNRRLHQRILHHFPQHTAISAANNQHLYKEISDLCQDRKHVSS